MNLRKNLTDQTQHEIAGKIKKSKVNLHKQAEIIKLNDVRIMGRKVQHLCNSRSAIFVTVVDLQSRC